MTSSRFATAVPRVPGVSSSVHAASPPSGDAGGGGARCCGANAGGDAIVRSTLLAALAIAVGCAGATVTPLHKAAEGGDLAEVNRLLDSGAKVDARDPREDLTPLGWAAAVGNVEVANALIARGADVNATSKQGFTPLHNAAYFHRQEMTALLLSKGANVGARTHEGETPLHRAMARYGPYRGSAKEPPSAASLQAMVDTAALLLERGADANAAAAAGVTPLMFAASTGHAPLVALLLDRGAALEARGPDGTTALYTAAVSGSADAAEVLLARGAKVDVATRSGYTPLSYAARSGAAKLPALLLDKGADVNARDAEGRTPLVWALSTASMASPAGDKAMAAVGMSAAQRADQRRRLASAEGRWHDVVVLLVARGANVAAHPPKSAAPLLLACNVGDVEVVGALLDHGAPLDDLSTGETALHAAIAERHPQVAALLLAKGARVDLVNQSRRTALHFVAAYLDDASLAEATIARGADVNARDAQGHTPLWYANEKKNGRVAEVLRSHGGK